MGVLNAVRRSYCYFIPRALLAPRLLARQLSTPALFGVTGLGIGASNYAATAAQAHISELWFVSIMLLAALRRWSFGSTVTDATNKECAATQGVLP
jgi:hypothetical protein